MEILIFATSARDAQIQCEELGVAFDEVVWVMNPALLGEMDVSHHSVHATPLFRQMPAFVDAKRRFPGLPDMPGDRPVPPEPPPHPEPPVEPGPPA